MKNELDLNSDPLLDVKCLKTEFRLKKGKVLRAVDGIDLTVRPGEIHGVVGESGSGKTVAALSMLRLIPSTGNISGNGIFWNGVDLLALSKKEMRAIRGTGIAMIFQNPQQSLNPLYTVGQQLVDVIRLHNRHITKKEAKKEALKWLHEVRIPDPEKRISAYPHQLSGGMCQRVVIAMALACEPKLLIADEPTASLDVTIQSQILNLLLEIREKYQMAMLFISHDLGVIARMCDRVSVMYLGKIMESADVETIYKAPFHPYTQALLKAIPSPDPHDKTTTNGIKGDIPNLIEIGKGCRFQNRCPLVFEKCRIECPPIVICNKNGSRVACWQYN